MIEHQSAFEQTVTCHPSIPPPGQQACVSLFFLHSSTSSVEPFSFLPRILQEFNADQKHPWLVTDDVSKQASSTIQVFSVTMISLIHLTAEAQLHDLIMARIKLWIYKQKKKRAISYSQIN